MADKKDAFGRPKKKTRLARFAEGGQADTDSDPLAEYRAQLAAQEATEARKAIPLKDFAGITPPPEVSYGKEVRHQVVKKLPRALRVYAGDTEDYRKGGKVKAKARGVGKALRGHGKGKMV